MRAVLVKTKFVSFVFSVTPKGCNVSVRMLESVILLGDRAVLIVRSLPSLIAVFLVMCRGPLKLLVVVEYV